MLKRGRPADVIRMVAPLLDQDASDPAFKRAVHRDLKSLMHSNQIGVDYYTPAGELIPPGEEEGHQNVRVEYYLLTHMDQEITGYQRFSELGGDMIAKPVLNSVIKFNEHLNEVPVNTYRISLEMRTGFFIHMWMAKEDRPVKLIIARTSKEMSQKSAREMVLGKLDARSLVLLLPNKAVSRLKVEDMTGHCEIDFTKKEEEVLLNDHNSHNGTFKAYGDDVKKTFMNFYINDQTMDGNYQNLLWGEINDPITLDVPSLIKAGNSLIFLDSV